MKNIRKIPISTVNCPFCHDLVQVSEEQFQDSWVCPTCGAKITIDKKKSDRIDELMKQVQEEQMKLHPEIYDKSKE